MRSLAAGCLIVAGLAFSPAPAGQEAGAPAWDAASWGDHRAVVRVAAPAEAVRVTLPWRRRDADPGTKAVWVSAAAGGERIRNVHALSVDRESGRFVFQPRAGAGDYFFYFLPYRLAGSRNYPQARYREAEATADPAWLLRWGLSGPDPEGAAARLPEAAVSGFQSVTPFHTFEPMERIATAAETRALMDRFPGRTFLLFPEDRRRSIRMTGDLPQRWIGTGPEERFSGEAERGEFYAFQIGLWACRAPAEAVEVRFSDLRGAGAPIPASALRCINTGGNDWDGRPFRKDVAVPPGRIQALWCGVDVPCDAVPGVYEGDVTVAPRGAAPQSVRLSLKVLDAVRTDHGDDEPERMSRLRWLDSRLAMDDEIVKPFTPVAVEGRTVGCLGRKVGVGPDGFPSAVRSYFSSDVTRVEAEGRDVLARPMALIVEDADGRILPWTAGGVKFGRRAPGRAEWEFVNSSGPLRLEGRAALEMDGYLEYRLRLSTGEAAAVKDIRLEVPFRAAAARYMMGLGWKGGLRPKAYSWTWDPKKNQDALWLGDVNAGMQIGWRAENYSRPLNTNFYLSKPLLMPPSWWNGGAGAVRVAEAGDAVLVTASSGARTLEPGRDLHFDFIVLLTPFKTIDPRAHFASRYFHAFKPVEEIVRAGANVVNVHHANAVNPFINYPFLRPAAMKAYIDEAHARGLKVKIYNTIRELSNRAPELHALRSLGPEIFTPGPGGGAAWLQEHLGSDYIPAWYVPELEDAAVINSGMSRWHNYYIEGLDWLASRMAIDGLYIDDVAFDRTTMKRVRKVLDRRREGALIDLHSANQYNPRDGYVSSATLYLEHFPYLDRLWFGEYFDYEGSPADYWLVEVSGIPFGLMGEMLQDGGNPWRGMVFGMTNRMPWSGRDPSRLWKVWDEFGMASARMSGYWADDCPVRTSDPGIAATAYIGRGKALVALASWAKTPVRARLRIDWAALGIDPKTARIRAPEISDFQMAAEFAPGEPVPFEPGKGWLLLIE